MKPTIYFLHIGKTGGTALKWAMLEYRKLIVANGESNNIFRYNKDATKLSRRSIPSSSGNKSNILLCSHSSCIEDVPVGDKIVMILRDPISRFVSAFYHRRRMNKDHTEQEKQIFSHFTTPNQLAASQANPYCDKHKLALSALSDIGHTNCVSDWYKSIEYFNSRVDDVLFIGFTETLDIDFENLKKLLHIPFGIALPKQHYQSNKGPRWVTNEYKTVSEPGLTFLKEWYKQDIEFVNLCKEIMVSRTV